MEIITYIKNENVEKVIDYLEENEEVDFDIVDDMLSSLTECSNKIILVNVLQFVDKIGYLEDMEPVDGSSLINCIDRNDFEKLQILVENLYNNQGLFDPCPLVHAIQKGKLEAVKLLEKNGFIMVSGDGGENEFTEAIHLGHLDIIKYYCEEVAERRGGFKPTDEEWIQLALKQGHEDVAEYLANLKN